MKRKYIILIISVLFIFIVWCVILNNKIKLKRNSEDTAKSDISNYNDLIYDYDETTNQYTIYDENGNIRGIVEDEIRLDLYRYDKTYTQANNPPGL